MSCPGQVDPDDDTGFWFAECTCPREHVRCDTNCGAFLEPETTEELKLAVEHWRKHRLSHGCSHGC